MRQYIFVGQTLGAVHPVMDDHCDNISIIIILLIFISFENNSKVFVKAFHVHTGFRTYFDISCYMPHLPVYFDDD